MVFLVYDYHNGIPDLRISASLSITKLVSVRPKNCIHFYPSILASVILGTEYPGCPTDMFSNTEKVARSSLCTNIAQIDVDNKEPFNTRSEIITPGFTALTVLAYESLSLKPCWLFFSNVQQEFSHDSNILTVRLSIRMGLGGLRDEP